MYKPSFKSSDPFIEELSTPESEVSIPLQSGVVEILPSEKVFVGITTRYFAIHQSDRNLLEINRNTYENLRTKSPRFDYLAYKVGELKWDTTFPIYDSMEGRYVLEGANTRNLKEVEKAEKILPGIKDYLVLKEELFI